MRSKNFVLLKITNRQPNKSRIKTLILKNHIHVHTNNNRVIKKSV